VIELADDGSAVVHAGPAVFTADGAQPLIPGPPRDAASAAKDVEHLLVREAQKQGLDARLLREVAWQESRFRHTAVSPRNAVGVMQLMPGTARDLGVDRFDLPQNIAGGAAYIRQMLDRYRGDVRLALAAYNAGPGAVDRHRGVPPYRETLAYVSAILSRLATHAPTVSPTTAAAPSGVPRCCR